MGLFQAFLGMIVPIRTSSAKLFDKTLLNNQIDWRCLKPEVKRDVIDLVIKMSNFKSQKGIINKAYIAEYVEHGANQIARYIILDDERERDPFVAIFKTYHSKSEFKKI